VNFKHTRHDFPTPPDPKTHSLYSDTGILKRKEKKPNRTSFRRWQQSRVIFRRVWFYFVMFHRFSLSLFCFLFFLFLHMTKFLYSMKKKKVSIRMNHSYVRF